MDSTNQFHNILFNDAKIQFIMLNSCCKIDRCFPKRSCISNLAFTHALDKANDDIERAKESGALSTDQVFRIAVWHHPVEGDDDAIKDTGFLERLRANNFKICLHGHTHRHNHKVIYPLYPNKLYIIGAGTSGVGIKDRPKCNPYEYNLLEIERDFGKVTVHTRCKRTENGAWEGWALWPSGSKFKRQTFYEIVFDRLEYAE